MKYGYARVSTDGQSVDAQVRQLTKTECKKVFRKVASGAKTNRAQLRKVLAQQPAGERAQGQRLDAAALARSAHCSTPSGHTAACTRPDRQHKDATEPIGLLPAEQVRGGAYHRVWRIQHRRCAFKPERSPALGCGDEPVPTAAAVRVVAYNLAKIIHALDSRAHRARELDDREMAADVRESFVLAATFVEIPHGLTKIIYACREGLQGAGYVDGCEMPALVDVAMLESHTVSIMADNLAKIVDRRRKCPSAGGVADFSEVPVIVQKGVVLDDIVHDVHGVTDEFPLIVDPSREGTCSAGHRHCAERAAIVQEDMQALRAVVVATDNLTEIVETGGSGSGNTSRSVDGGKMTVGVEKAVIDERAILICSEDLAKIVDGH